MTTFVCHVYQLSYHMLQYAYLLGAQMIHEVFPKKKDDPLGTQSEAG
jgi:hypothetical protein